MQAFSNFFFAGSWTVGSSIAGAAALATEAVNANKSLLTGIASRPHKKHKCDKNHNKHLKACDKDGDGGVNEDQGACTLAECNTLCEMHIGFQCRFIAYARADQECYLFDHCKQAHRSGTYDIYAVGNGTLDSRLEFTWGDSGCSSKQALMEAGKLFTSRTRGVIGPGCSAACESTSYLFQGRSLPQISWGCLSTLFSLLFSLYLRFRVLMSHTCS